VEFLRITVDLVSNKRARVVFRLVIRVAELDLGPTMDLRVLLRNKVEKDSLSDRSEDLLSLEYMRKVEGEFVEIDEKKRLVKIETETKFFVNSIRASEIVEHDGETELHLWLKDPVKPGESSGFMVQFYIRDFIQLRRSFPNDRRAFDIKLYNPIPTLRMPVEKKAILEVEKGELILTHDSKLDLKLTPSQGFGQPLPGLVEYEIARFTGVQTQHKKMMRFSIDSLTAWSEKAMHFDYSSTSPLAYVSLIAGSLAIGGALYQVIRLYLTK
jgi:hypothetical protein